ncbi:hypothetical protein [Endozoicomonas ascidiicola]|uniref:hypothetical protein n=1 Tax=Endozoicomonas ascidiicola TaxID=1698521 RepID=UPI000836EB8F|nr:hypothetical protein [Endozoicomonas ascidiicola]
MPEHLPPIPKALLTALRTRFPLRNPQVTVSERELWMEVGKQDLLEFLEFHLQKQQDNVMKDSHVLR